MGVQHRQMEESIQAKKNDESTLLPTSEMPDGDRPAPVYFKKNLSKSETISSKPPAQVSTNGRQLIFPVQSHDLSDVISVYGDPRGRTRKHQGIDIKAPKGTEILAVADGFIERVSEGGNAGKSVYLRAADGKLYFYAHLDKYEVEEMQAVEAGEPIGTVGDTGNAKNTTPHLHFEILIGKDKEAVDPLPYFLGA